MRRFGISIPEDLAEVLDTLAERLGVPRSEIVREALRMYFRDHAHYMTRHRCYGIITVVSEGFKHLSTVEEFKEIVNTFSHIHIDEYCINSFVVSGDSNRIAELHRELLKVCRDVRYIPLECKL